MIKDKIEFLGVELQFNGSSKKEIEDARLSFDFGTLRLAKGNKELILDGAQSNAVDHTIYLELEEHTMLESKNDLTEFFDLDVAEMYIGSEYEITPDTMTLFIRENGNTRAIDLNID